MGERKLSIDEAMSIVPDDLPDGAFFAMADELAGFDCDDGFAAADEIELPPLEERKPFKCPRCAKRFRAEHSVSQHLQTYHARSLRRDLAEGGR